MENPQESTSDPTVISSITSPVVQETVESVESITHLKETIRTEIQKETYPDLVFLYSPEALWVALDVLKELLNKEKEDFLKVVNIPDEEIVFENFIQENLYSYYFLLLKYWKWIIGNKEITCIIDTFEPLIIEFENEKLFHSTYYQKLKYALSHLDLTSDQKRILEIRIRKYEKNGIHLPWDVQEKIKTLNIELTNLQNSFQKNNVWAKNDFSLHFVNDELLQWIPENILNEASENARKTGLPGYIFDQNPNAYIAIMKYCHSKDVRKQFYDARHQFASNGEFDNRGTILEILKLREQKAKLLWYKNHAESMLDGRMAQKPDTVLKLIQWISIQAKNKLEQEIQTLKAFFWIQVIDPEDLEYYATAYKQDKFSINEEELKEYFEYNNVLWFMFEFAKEFYQIDFKQIHTELPYKEMSLYEVYKNGKLISYFLLDPFYRKSKKSWAWADNPRWRFYHKVPVVVNACNFENTSPSLLSKDDMVTLFHEFGHALHEILSQSPYSELSWFGVAWDYVELPSQLHENWVSDPESLKRFARHYQTGEVLPQKTIDTLSNLNTFMSGQWTLRQNEFALVDMYLHVMNAPQTIEELDRNILNMVNAFWYFPRWEEYKSYASFSHIFYSGYDAWYYSYMWAEILEADVFARIKELWMFNPEVGKHFLETILWQGCRKPESELFKDFMWRELDNTAFMKKKWLM